MKTIAKYLALLALALTVVPPALVLIGGLSSETAASPTEIPTADPADEIEPGEVDFEEFDEEIAEEELPGETTQSSAAYSIISDSAMKGCMLAGAILWFATAPTWLKEDEPGE